MRHWCVSALLCCLAAFAPPAAAAALRIAMAADVGSMDPHFANISPNVVVSSHVFETLTTVDADARLMPGLAESWRAVGPTTWEFKLREGVRFHDGTELTADDVLYSLDRPATIKNTPGGFTTFTKPIVRKEAVDRYTVRLHTAAPYAMVPYDLVSVFIVSRRAAEGATSRDFDDGRAMVGTGPYRFVRFNRGESVELVRNEDYWGRKPQWERVSLRIIPSDPARIAALLAGDVDMIENVPPADAARLERDPRFRVERKVSWRTIFLVLDQDRERSPFVDAGGRPNPLRDARVRLALSKAIDRKAICDKLMDGFALPTANIVAPPVFGHAPALEAEAYDPAAAKALLAEAGYGDGFALTLHGPNNRYINDELIVQAVAQMWARIGLRTAVQTMPVNVYFPKARARSFSVGLLGWGSFSGDLALRSLVMSENAAAGTGVWNWGRYSNPEVDELVRNAFAALDPAVRESLTREATIRAMRETAIIPLYHQIASWALRRDLRYVARTDEFTLAFDVHKEEAP
ncbi:MAG: ABC transporter substrate-binding protein [Pseudomonadota bacterium]|nr:MAG: ABC transporter substrate-binding protein [Pseudomonadota bacterium]